MWDSNQQERVDDVPLTNRQFRIDVLLAVAGMLIAICEAVAFSEPASTEDLLVLMAVTVAPAAIAVRRLFPISVFICLGAVFASSLALGHLSIAVIVVLGLTLVPAGNRFTESRPADLLPLIARPGNAIWVDALLATMAAAAYVVALAGTSPTRSLAPLLGLTAAVAALHRTAPIVSCVLLAQLYLLSVWSHAASGFAVAFVGVGFFILAFHRRLLVALPVATNLLAYLIALTALSLTPQQVDDKTIGVSQQILQQKSLLAMAALALISFSIGALLRMSRGARASAAREALWQQQAVEHEEAEAIMTERATIARDLHDVVAHHVSLIVLQSETGPDLVGQGQDQAVEGFERIGDTGRRALDELDRMLAALRDPKGVTPADLGPSPGLADLRDLVSEVRRTDSATVSLVVQGVTDGPPAGHQLSAYRIVQEALTNVVRYASAATATVTVEITPGAISLQIVDDGVGFDPRKSPGGGHGLLGMRERARIHGGTLAVISAPGDGTTIQARLPIETMG